MHHTHHSLNSFEEETSDSRSTAVRNSSHNSYVTDSPPLVNSPDHNSDSLSENSKKIRKKRNTYQKIDDATRMRLLDAVQQGETLKAAAKRQGINYSSAKSILHTYRKEGRIFKKSAQERIAKKRTKASSDLEMSPIYPYKQFQGFGDVSESPVVYGSLDFQQKTGSLQGNGSVDGTNGVTINSFGDFLKVDSQGRAKSDNSYPSSTIMLKLDSQKFQRVPTINNVNINTNSAPKPMFTFNTIPATPSQGTVNNSKNIQSGNWHLNVNVQSENPQKPKALNLKEGSFSMNFTTSAKKDVPEYDQRFLNNTNTRRYEGTNDMTTTMTNSENHHHQHNHHYVPEEQNYDVSCFLNSSSPAYSFPQKASTGMEQIVDNMNISGENNMHHDYYGKFKEGNYLSFGQKLEQGTPGILKTASLRSY